MGISSGIIRGLSQRENLAERGPLANTKNWINDGESHVNDY